MTLKSTVSLRDLKPQLLLALFIADKIWSNFTPNGLTITSVNDGPGVHLPTSLHYQGYAADLRIKDIPENQWELLLTKLKENLTVEYDIILEKDKLHIHVEWDPKKCQSGPILT